MRIKLCLFMAASLQGIAFAQAPIISYTTPQNYAVGVAISALTPTTTGGAVTYGTVTTLAGSGSQGSANGTGSAASFKSPVGVGLDAAGNVYVADGGNQKIRKITPAGVVTTFAGSGSSGSADGTGTAASFNYPTGPAVDAAGNLYIADSANHKIRKITPAGVVTTLAGSGSAGSVDGTGSGAKFNYPSGPSVDAAGNVYVADESNNKIRKITPAGVVTTLAGGTKGAADGNGAAASFNLPIGTAVDASGNVYVADYNNNTIRMITPAGDVSTIAGSTTAGATDGIGTAASFSNPFGLALDAAGNLYVGDQGNHKIRKIDTSGVVSTLAGGGSSGPTDGIGTAASFNFPKGVAVDASGNVYVSDYNNNKIRKIDASGGYSITPPLPAGLSLDPAIGTISGTPTAVSPQTTYTVTAANKQGAGTASITIAIGNGPTITYDPTPQLYYTGTDIAPYPPTSVVGDPVITFSIAPPLPDGLNIDPTTGIISGNPTVGGVETVYIVTATNTYGTGTAAVDITVYDTLGVEDLAFKNMLVDPNPTKAEVNISNVLVEKVSVYNTAGQLVKTVTNPQAANSTTVQLNNLSTGIYYMNIETQNGRAVRKVIKQ